MTRDEAKAKITPWQVGVGLDNWLVNALTSLGVLKLDEPKSPRDKFKEAMRAEGYSEGSLGYHDALRAFDAATK